MSGADIILKNTEGWKREGLEIRNRFGNSIALCRTVNDASMLISCVNLARTYCRQVNAHDELVAALEKAVEAIDHAPSDTWGEAGGGEDGVWPLKDEMLSRFRAALAKAKGDEG